ncbi:MAG: hypothetical protein HYV77_01185 [Candidatus Wildermuthbacteria bacterium]|nr:hypothetical protein [Candidatus Wildermuthbacteria bacterium]
MRNNRQWQVLSLAALQGELSHAYAFLGSDASVKKETALRLIQLANCQSENRDAAKDVCGTCRACMEIGNYAFADLLWVREEDEIKIEAVRQIASHLALAPYASAVKFVVIENAHLMNHTAQSAFLKVLEEPRGNTVIILLAEYPALLLDTILSRTQQISFYSSLSAHGTDKETLKTAQEFEKCLEIPLIERFERAKKLADNPGKIPFTLAVWLGIVRKNMLKELQVSNTKEVVRWKHIVEKIEEVLSYIQRTNVNKTLAIEQVMLALP